ncbi:flagellar hook-basal body complex protein FliE [Lentibacter algarum]|uniref:flagellar hook-basal body complex protein FliE n=1 Tax=Lentibacter algarum TaxID=576131 RepID=UPI001C077D44|nr:flagellar hook-basal body complex protein FliE [Lentibacter algarum]MBU2981204.1 flagellar hook-basal body complex protein FliE [Lentibacter algarum]
MDIRALNASQNYASLKPATQPTHSSDTAERAFGKAAGDFASALKQSEELAMSAMTGNADPHALVQALAQTELAVEAAVTVRNKVVQAYQEILRMPV